MGKKDLYTIQTESEGLYKVLKFDSDHQYQESYHISELGTDGEHMICSCPAGNKHTCRHRKMLRLFQALKRLDSGWMYSYDTDKWLEPANPEE